jgi:hypothetical protein
LAEATPVAEREPVANRDIEPWELHSELVLVCPDVCKRARELLPERDPDAFLAGARDPVLVKANTIDGAQRAASLPIAVAGYTLWRLLETARIGLLIVGGTVALALLAEAVR